MISSEHTPLANNLHFLITNTYSDNGYGELLNTPIETPKGKANIPVMKDRDIPLEIYKSIVSLFDLNAANPNKLVNEFEVTLPNVPNELKQIFIECCFLEAVARQYFALAKHLIAYVSLEKLRDAYNRNILHHVFFNLNHDIFELVYSHIDETDSVEFNTLFFEVDFLKQIPLIGLCPYINSISENDIDIPILRVFQRIWNNINDKQRLVNYLVENISSTKLFSFFCTYFLAASMSDENVYDFLVEMGKKA